MAKVLPIRKTVYLAARAEVKEIRQAGPAGEREFRIKWIDRAVGQPVEWEAGTVVSFTVTGSVQRGTYKVLTEQHEVDTF